MAGRGAGDRGCPPVSLPSNVALNGFPKTLIRNGFPGVPKWGPIRS
jgi:hypothetical protein